MNATHNYSTRLVISHYLANSLTEFTTKSGTCEDNSISCLFASPERTKIPFTLDWKFEGPSAPFFNAIDKGYFKDAGLDVEISPGKGSLDAIPKVATGSFPLGFADINSLIKFLDQNPGAPVTAIMMIYDKPPFAVIGRKSLGIKSPADLPGSVLGAPPPDGAWAQFPSFAKANGAKAKTLSGLSGLGDLSLTCNSQKSRNFVFGLSLGCQKTFNKNTTVEGVATAFAVSQKAKALGLDMPITSSVRALVNGSISTEEVIHSLLSRPTKEE